MLSKWSLESPCKRGIKHYKSPIGIRIKTSVVTLELVSIQSLHITCMYKSGLTLQKTVLLFLDFHSLSCKCFIVHPLDTFNLEYDCV